MRKGTIALTLGTLIAFSAAPAFADLELVEESTKPKGATEVTWDSSFADFDYAEGRTITMTVNWTVNTGTATFNDFVLRGKGYTPRSRKDPADGTAPTILSVTDSGAAVSQGSVTVSFEFSCLHLDKKREVEIGNAHFKLLLNVDIDGDGFAESEVGYGVNVHVEEDVGEDPPIRPCPGFVKNGGKN